MKMYKERQGFRPLILELMTDKECGFLYVLLNGPGIGDLEKWVPSNMDIKGVFDFKEKVCKAMREIRDE